MRILLFALPVLLAGVQVAHAQAVASVAAVAPSAASLATPPDNSLRTFFSAPEVVLPKLYEAAIVHSGEIARLDASRSVAEADLKLARKRLLNMLALTGSYTYGTLPYFATAQTNTGPNSEPIAPVYQVNPFNLGARAQFSVGAGFVVPIDVLATHRTTINRQNYLVDQAWLSCSTKRWR
jgi:outer membrane protein TolC